jgi:renal tumor antigen
MHKYRLIAKKGEGTFSEVLKAQCIKNGKMVAIKCMKSHFESPEQVNNLREIQALRRLSPHPHIIRLLEVLYDQPTGRLALVFELMDMNIYELIRGRRQYLSEHRVKNFMYQLIKSMDHMHRNGIFHRDIKPENILILDDGLKLADFGSCRGIYSKQPYTEYISTRWYRAPECLLTDGYYNYKMDLWGVGCVFFEIVSLFPLFPGTNELDQIQKIHNIIGTPPAEFLAKLKRHSSHIDFNFPAKDGSGIAKLIPHASAECVDLIMKLLAYNPEERLSARQALRHQYFKEMRELEKRSQMSLSPSLAASAADDESVRGGHSKKDRSDKENKPDEKARSHALPSIRNSDRHVRDSVDTKSEHDHGTSGTLPHVHSGAHHGHHDEDKVYMPSLKVEGGGTGHTKQGGVTSSVRQGGMHRGTGTHKSTNRQPEYIKSKASQHSSRSNYSTRSMK